MSNFPNNFDDDTTLPFVNDNITEIGGPAINALRDVAFALEQNIGLGAAGSAGSIAARLGVALDPAGNIKASALTSLGLVTLPITDGQISNTAQIAESKLRLDHRTQDLFNYIRDLSGDINIAIGWISGTGVQLDPHLIGALYRHSLDQIDVSHDTVNFPYLSNKFRQFRDNSEAYKLVSDINSELLAHQWADGSPFGTIANVTTNNGSVYPSNYAHTASGIFLNTTRFATIPQTANDLQQFAQFIDSASIFLLGTRIQNLYSNGISRESRSSSLSTDGYGSPLIPVTPAIAYLKNIGTSSGPVDDINTGDDIIEFKPSAADLATNSFDEKFALVKVGDIVRINYGSIEVPFVIKEKKYIQNSGNKKFIVRIAGKNLAYAPNAQARIDKPLFNNNKYGVLALAAANSGVSTIPSSLIIGSSRGAQTLGLGFNPDQFDASHYLLYLALYPTGNPQDGYLILPPVDVTGNQGATPGLYTLDSIVASTNNTFRKVGYNYRFIAFQYQGEFGIMLADSYNNTGFSILNAVVTPSGTLDPVGTDVAFPNNVVGVFPPSSPVNSVAPDPLGFGINGAAIASPAFQKIYGSAEAALYPTKLFLPHKRNNYYVNGTEREKLTLDIGQALDGYGDGYWVGTINAQTIIPGPSPTGRVQTTYRIPLDLSASQLKVGKTVVVQKLDGYGIFPNDFGRFIVQSVAFGCAPADFTDITVYDAVHATAVSPSPSSGIGGTFAIYFNSDSVALNQESATDFTAASPFKRYFEVYINENSETFTHERGRFNAGNVSPLTINGSVPLYNYSELVKMNILKISPKLRGYQFGSVTKITLNMVSFDSSTGFFDGYLSSWDGSTSVTHKGPLTYGKKGEVTRFYDETNTDFIDILFDVNTPISTFFDQHIDIQLFPTLSLDNEEMLIGTCQFNDVTNIINYVRDERQFGNISTKEFSTSALQFLSHPERVLFGNGVVRGFDIADTSPIVNPNGGQIYMMGGEVLVNGNFIQIDDEMVVIPTIKEFYSGTLYNVNWVLCVNSNGEYQPIPLLDYDPSLSTPNNASRLFQAFNLVNGQTYYLDAITFSDIINKRKDLAPLYIVAATTVAGSGSTPPSITLLITDARKYVNDVDTNLPLRLTSVNSQGNFKNPVAILNWIKYNNAFNGTAIVRGAEGISGTISTAINLSFNSTVTIEGENEAFLTMNAPVTIGSNLSLRNLEITFNGDSTTTPPISISNPVNNLNFENCVIRVNFASRNPAVNNVIFDFVNSNNITFNNCDFIINYNANITPPSDFTDLTQYASVFRLNNVKNFNFTNNSLTVNYSTSPGVYVPGNVFVLLNSPKVRIADSTFSGNFNALIANNLSPYMHLSNLFVTSSYNPYPTGSSSPDYNYDPSNLVNSGQGYIYSKVASSLDGITIDNVVFNYNPAGNPASDISLNNRFSFINFELSTTSSALTNLQITNCKFNHLNVGVFVEDNKAAISIINISPTSSANSTQPLLINANISNNRCNRNQSIIITSKTIDSPSGTMNFPGLEAQDCIIDSNVCGYIGYWITSISKYINIIPNVNSNTDKMSGLTVENNICHMITNTDHKGYYFLVNRPLGPASGNQCAYPSGHVIIRANKCNWIHTGIAYEEDSSLHIVNNSLSAYDSSYLFYFAESTTNTYGNVSQGFAIFVSSNKHISTPSQTPGESNDSTVVISGNTTSTGYWLQTTGTNFTYKYQNGYIFTASSAVITDNILKGVSSTGTYLIQLGGTSNIVTGNKIYRQGSTILGYVGTQSYDIPAWGGDLPGTNSTGIVTDNIFDSPYISDTTLNEQTVYLYPAGANRWIVQRNKNQTGTAILPFSNRFIFNGGFGFGPPILDVNLTVSPINDVPATSSLLPWGGARSQNLVITDTYSLSGGPFYRFWYAQENLEKYVPNGVRVVSLTGGFRPWESVVDFYTSTPPAGHVSSNYWLNISHVTPTVTVGANTYDFTQLDYLATYTSPDLSIAELNSPVDVVVSGGQINSTYTNIPYSINLENYASSGDISYNYITGKGSGITVAFAFVWGKTSSTAHFTLSPVKVKYRW
jgi:hypothetical protein